MATTGHESEAINVQGLKASLQKLKTNHIDGKAGKSTTLAGYGITDAYTKSETYTKTDVNGLVDTPHQEYVTVDAYANLPATGSKDTIYRVSNYNGSTNQVDASVYSEYAWNGTQYIFLCVKSQIGEVFDISVYNNNAKYADLAAALGTDGEHVPQSLRKGGMSVKFVRSSDNKYVQYRLMSDSFNTTVANWQGVDDEPTAESDNLIKSDGVSKYMLSNYFIGNNTTLSKTEIYGLPRGTTYKLILDRTNWDTSFITYQYHSSFIIQYYINGSEQIICDIYPVRGQTPKKFYRFTIPDNSDGHLSVWGRAISGDMVKFLIVEDTSFPAPIYLTGPELPNIDSKTGILDLGSDPDLYIGDTFYKREVMSNYRNIIIQPSSGEGYDSSRRKLCFDTLTGTFSCKNLDTGMLGSEVVIGTFTTTYSTTGFVKLYFVDLPFPYTIDGKSPNDFMYHSNELSYSGERPNFPQKANYTILLQLTAEDYTIPLDTQGFDIKDDKIFQGSRSTTNTITVIDINTKTVIGQISYNQDACLNTIQCGEKYDNLDTYPMLYVSDETDGKCSLIRLQNDLSGYIKVQSISYIGTEHFVGRRINKDWVVDIDNGYIYILNADNNNLECVKFPLPLVSNSTVEYSDGDVIDSFICTGVPNIWQGSKIYNNTLYMAYGFGTSSAPGYILGINLTEKREITRINLGTLFGEPEDLAIYKNKFVLVNNSTNPIWRVIEF